MDTLEERQDLNVGAAELQERLAEHHAKSPELSGGDIDAACGQLAGDVRDRTRVVERMARQRAVMFGQVGQFDHRTEKV